MALNGPTGSAGSVVTDSDGRGTFKVRRPGDYTVNVTHSGYKTYQGPIKLSEDEEAFDFEIGLESSRGPQALGRRMVSVRAYGPGETGQADPVANAEVLLSTGQSGVTDANGEFWLLHAYPVGTVIDVTVIPEKGLKRTSGTVVVKADANSYDKGKLGEGWRPEWFQGGVVNVVTGTARGYETAFGRSAIDDCPVRCEQGENAPTLDGSISTNKGRYAIKEPVWVSLGVIAQGFDSGAFEARQVVELRQGDSKVLVTDESQVGLSKDEYQRRSLKVKCDVPGEYTIRCTTTIPGVKPHVMEARFTVVGSATPTRTPGGSGYYKLVQTLPGTPPTSTKFYGGDLAGVLNPNSLVYTLTPNNTSMGFTTTLGWELPKESLPAGELIEMGCSTKTTVTLGQAPPDHWGVGWTADQANHVDPQEGGANAMVGWLPTGLILSIESKARLKLKPEADTLRFSVVTYGCALYPSGYGTLATYVYQWQSGKTPVEPAKPKVTQEPEPEVVGNYQGDTLLPVGNTNARATFAVTISPSGVSGQMLVSGQMALGSKTYEIKGTYWVKRKSFGAVCEPSETPAPLFVTIDGSPSPRGLIVTIRSSGTDSLETNTVGTEFERVKKG